MNEPKRDDCPFERHPIPPELLEVARAEFNEAEVLAELEEVRRTGGYTLKDILAVFDEVASSDDERAA